MSKKKAPVGSLRHLITIQQQARTTDGMGGFTTTWSTYLADQWAKIEPLKAHEIFYSMQFQLRVSHKIIIRKVDGLRTDMRIQFGSRVFQVKGFRAFDEEARFTEIMAEEGAGA